MKRISILCSLTLCALSLQAETAADSLKRQHTDPWYFQLYVGINKSANENLPWTEFTAYPWSVGGFFGIGKEISPLWGWRAALRLNHNKSRNVQECESNDTYGWTNLGLFGDVTFDVTDLFSMKHATDTLDLVDYDDEGNAVVRQPKRKRFNLKAFAGVGAAYTWGFTNVPLSYTHPYSRSSKLLPAVRAGVTATWQLNRRWRIGTELSHTMFEDHFNGVSHDFPLDGRTNLKVGLTYLLMPRLKKPIQPIVRRVKLKQCPILPLVMPDPEGEKKRQIVGRAFLDFPVNETIIYPTYRNNPAELSRIHASVDSALFDKTIVITRITLHGYASPESPYSNNTRLAKGRTEALKNYLIRKYGFQPKVFDTTFTPEDWENLRGFLTNMDVRRVKGDFWYDTKTYTETPEAPEVVVNYRDELLKVIGRQMDPDAKEELLKRVGGGQPYQWLLQHVYPGLRHTDYTIDYDVKPFPTKQGRRLIYTHPEGLSLEEMYRVAMSYDEGSEGWTDALIIAARQYPDDPTANLNAACACVKTKRLGDAKSYLLKAGRSQQASYVADIISAMEGRVKWKMEYGRLTVIED